MTTEIRFATQPTPDVINEDHVVATPGLVCVFDGVTAPAELETGCAHGTPWYVRRLAARLTEAHSRCTAAAVGDLVATAIDAVRGDHDGICDLSHPGTPAATVCLLRIGETHADYLVLADSPLVLDRGGLIETIIDMRLQETSAMQRRTVVTSDAAVGTRQYRTQVLALVESQRTYRNKPGGYWLAAATPDAGSHAVTGTVPLTGENRITRAGLLTDGASRLVDTFALTDWRGLLDLAQAEGPARVIDRVRQAEREDGHAIGQRRIKVHDDATMALCLF